MRKKSFIAIILTILVSLSLVSCSTVDNIMKRVGLRNEYFEYLKTNKIDKISIQSKRDPGFKFIVTENNAIKNMYNILSKAKESNSKSNLDVDYIFEIYIGDQVKKYNYIAGGDKGNFYNDEVSFTVSNRLDEVLMQNLSVIRKPRDFDYIYYNSILNILNMRADEMNSGNNKVGIDIQGDIDCLKYIFSTDIEKFLKSARKITPNVSLVNNNSNEFDFVLTVKSRGFNTTTYKTNIFFEDKKNHMQKNYYILGINEFDEWNIHVYDEEDIPTDVEKNW